MTKEKKKIFKKRKSLHVQAYQKVTYSWVQMYNMTIPMILSSGLA